MKIELVFVVAFAFTSSAFGQVIDFEGELGPGNPAYDNIPITLGEFELVSPHVHTIDTPSIFSGPVNASAVYAAHEGGSFGGDITLTRTDGMGFNVLGLDLAELWVGNNSTYPNAQRVRVVGNFVGGGAITDFLTLDGMLDGPGGLVDFESFTLSGFVGLSSFVMIGVDGANNPDFAFSLDNIVVGNSTGTAFCSGDGSGTACPCGNFGVPGAGCSNSAASAGALLVATGAPVIGSDTVVFSATGCPANKPGIFFQGSLRANGGLGVSFGDGLLCASGQIIRLETVFTDGAGNATSTAQLSTTGSVSPGDTRTYQYWFRDPIGAPCGSGFNTTNGWEITWQ